MVTVRLFAGAAEAAGAREVRVDAHTVGHALAAVRAEAGPRFEAVLAACSIWLGDEPVPPGRDLPVHDGDEIAVLPPVSGGCT